MTISKKHILRIIGWAILTVLLLIIGTGALVYFKAESYINQNLSDFVAEKSNNLYELSFSKIELEISPLTLSVSDITLKPNKTKSIEILQKYPDKTFYSFHSTELNINDLDLIGLIKNQFFYCKNLTVLQPEFSLSGEGILQNDSTKNFNKAIYELWPIFKKRIKNVLIDEIHFVDANYKLYQSASDFTEISKAQKISMEIKKFRTDSAIIFNDSRFFESDDILISINHFHNNLSDSIHVLNIDKLEYSLKSTDIFAYGFHLIHKEKNSNKNLYDVQVPSLYLKSNSITGITLNDSIEIEYLKFEKPQIKFFQKENQKKIEIEDINQFDLYSLVEDQFTKVKVDSFVLVDANLKIFQQPDTINFQQHFKSLTITLNGFELDSTSAKNIAKIFHADDLKMSVNGYHLKLIDKQHEFNADSMFVSTQSNMLGIKNIRIAPSIQADKKARTSVNVECEALEIDNVNFKTLFHTRTLPTRRISITNPKVQLQYHSEIIRNKEKKEVGLLLKLVSAYLKGVYSEVVEIENGSLNIQTLNNTILKGYFETDFNFNLSGFALDSASMQQTDKFFYANNFDLQFTNYEMKLVDNLHKINVDKISIQSFDRKLQIENLRLKPVVNNADLSIMQSFNRSELYNITIPKITLWGINLRDAFFYNKLNITHFHVTKPKIYFENFGVIRQTKDKKEFSELYQLVSNYIYDFNIKKISIPSGDFAWVNHTKKGKTTSFDNEFSATLYGFRLNKNEFEKQRLLFSDNFDISVKDQIFQLSDSVHILKAGEINLSSKNSNISIKNALLYPLISSPKHKHLSTTFQVTIPELQISNFDFLKAYKSKDLLLNTIELNEPKFEVYSKKGISKSLDLNKFDFPLPAFVKSFQINEFKINNGEVINYETMGLEQHAQSNFRLNLTLPNISLKNNQNNLAKLTTGNLVLNLIDFKTPLGKHHILKIAELDFDRMQKTISVSQLTVNPFAPKQTGNQFIIAAPQIQFTGFDINNAIKNNYFEFNEIDISNPKISIDVNDSIKGDKLEYAKNLDLFQFVEPYVNKIKVNKLQLQNVDLNLKLFEKELIDKQFNLSFNDINIAEGAKSENLLNSKEFEISTTNLQTTNKNGFYKFTADSLIYNSKKHNAIFKNIKVTPLLSEQEFYKKNRFQSDYVQVTTDFIELKGVNENQWFKQNIIEASSLVIGCSEFDISRSKRLPFNTEQRPPWPQDLLREIKQSFVFDSIILNPSVLKYNELLEISDEPGFIEFNDLIFKSGKVSNIPNLIKQNPSIKIDASAKLYNLGILNMLIHFDLSSSIYKHTLTGNLESMDLKPLNSMLEKSTPISIESGQLNRLDFNLTFTENNATGELFLAYNDFKISVMEYNKDGNKRSKFASFWANKMVLNSKSPKGNKLLPTSIYYERDIQRSILNYWWKTLFTGSKETIGLKPDKSK